MRWLSDIRIGTKLAAMSALGILLVIGMLVAEIAAASQEQSTGIDQINKALTQMDEVTQQNSALVEENSASAKTLEHQSEAMNQKVAFFKLDHGAAPGAARAPARRATVPAAAGAVRDRRAGSGPVGRLQAAVGAAVAEDKDWQEF